MKINLENMKRVGEKLDRISNADISDVGLSIDDVTMMAYQLQYFFEAIEKIKSETNQPIRDMSYHGLVRASNILTKALVDKED